MNIGVWELRLRAELVNPNDPSDIMIQNVIIQWNGDVALQNRRAVKALVADFPEAGTGRNTNNRWIRNPDGSYLQDEDGNNILTRVQVARGEQIAPMGDSGTRDAHLHLGLNYPDDNPLLYLEHNECNYRIDIMQPTPNQVIYHTSSGTTELIRINVVSREGNNGLDLNNVNVYLNKPGEESFGEDDRINERRENRAEINYGGLDTNYAHHQLFPPAIGERAGSITRTGVIPIVNGNDDFIFTIFNSKIDSNFAGVAQSNNEARYRDGRWVMMVAVTNINGRRFVQSQNIIIDNFKPQIREFEVQGLGSDRGQVAKIGDLVRVRIRFDQEMDPGYKPEIRTRDGVQAIGRVEGSWQQGP